MQYLNPRELEELTMRVASIEHTLVTLNSKDIAELIYLLKQVKTALKVFVALGNAFKWLIGLGAALGALWYAFKMAMK